MDQSQHVNARKTNKVWAFFCPVCKMERRFRSKPTPEKVKYFFQIILTTAVLGILLWPWCGWRSIFLIIPIWVIFEVTYRWRMRNQIPCPHCGFDAFLYLVDPKLAKKEVENYWKASLSASGKTAKMNSKSICSKPLSSKEKSS